MRPGTFLVDPNFTFEDGTTSKKIFITLSVASNGIYIVAKMTSNGARYGITHGCQISDRFPNYFLVKGSCFLKESTWIQFETFYELTRTELSRKITSGEIWKIGELTLEETKLLLGCCSYAEDLSGYQEEQITEAIKHIKDSTIK